MSFNFGTPKTATGFTLPTNTAAPSTATSGAGDSKIAAKAAPNLFATPPASSGFSLGGPAAKTATPALNFGLGTSAAPNLSFTTTPASSAATPQFNLGGLSAAAPATTVPAAATSFNPLFGGTTAATAPGVSLASASVAPTSAALKLTPSLASVAPATSSTGFGLSTTAAPTLALPTSSAAAPGSILTANSLSYAQLEDSINKWTIDLEDQGKFFINQAKQLNAWDNLLVSNSDKILSLNETIERVKQQQKQLDQELDFVLAQQNELDELSLPLEKQLNDIPVTDQNRFQMYQLSEIIDSQLKQMSEDLKEIVEHLNESNKEEDISDPVIQISRILNAHMNSLQWVDRNTSQICTHLDQISKMHEVHKKNHLNL